MAWLGQLGALGWVEGETTMPAGVERVMPARWTPGGQISARMSAHRAPRTWDFTIEAAEPANVRGYELARDGRFGTPVLWISDLAAAWNLLTPEQTAGARDYDQPMWSNSTTDLTPSILPDGHLTGGSSLQINPTQDRLLLDAFGQPAKLPVLPGRPIHCSALLSQAGAFVDVLFYNVAGQYLTTVGAPFQGSNNILERTTISVARVPATAHHAGFRVRGGGRIVDPVVTLGVSAAPTSSSEGLGATGVHVESVSRDPWTGFDGPGGMVSDYSIVIREADRI